MIIMNRKLTLRPRMISSSGLVPFPVKRLIQDSRTKSYQAQDCILLCGIRSLFASILDAQLAVYKTFLKLQKFSSLRYYSQYKDP